MSAAGSTEDRHHARGAYQRHQPERTVVFKTIQAHWETFLAELPTSAEPPVLPAFVAADVAAPQPDQTKAPLRRRPPIRHPWASLIWRVFLIDVLQCARCNGRMEITAALTAQPAIGRVLRHLGLPTEPPGFHPARPPPQPDLPFSDEIPDYAADPPAPEPFDA